MSRRRSRRRHSQHPTRRRQQPAREVRVRSTHLYEREGVIARRVGHVQGHEAAAASGARRFGQLTHDDQLTPAMRAQRSAREARGARASACVLWESRRSAGAGLRDG
eukprot:1298537-Prymnesium_polylepis.2